MTILRQLQTFATGVRLTARYCRYCDRRLFDGIMIGELKCRCGMVNKFTLATENKSEYKLANG